MWPLAFSVGLLRPSGGSPIAKGGNAVLAVTFMVVEESVRSSELVFSVLRVCDRRQNLISHHQTEDEAICAAQRYAVQARFSGLDAVVFHSTGVSYATEASGLALPL